MVTIRLARHGAKKRPFYQVVVADSQHFVSEGIGAYGVVIFTDEGAFGIVDSFRNTNHNVAVFLKCTAYLRKEFLCVKSCLRQINKKADVLERVR